SDFYPFGGERAVTSSSGNHYKFTGKERDTESNLDYFIARYYSSAQGRFLSPDEFTGGPVDAFSANDPLPPGPLPYADITNPQSFNKYSYAWNSPLRFVDPNGHDVVFANDSLEQRFNSICAESSTFCTAVAQLDSDSNILVKVVERGLRQNEEKSQADATVTFYGDGSTTVTIYIDTYRTPDSQIAHEVGHADDASKNREQFKQEGLKDKKQKGSSSRQAHDDRPFEKRANAFRDKVERERQNTRKQQKEWEKRRKQEERQRKKSEKERKKAEESAT
ncbi:MAG: RHS repeat-associated core domain-containing protein, partial [Candidatus Acidiferrales bacterium]